MEQQKQQFAECLILRDKDMFVPTMVWNNALNVTCYYLCF